MYIDRDPISAKLELESCSQELKKVISEIRDTIFDLRPMTFDDLGFKECIETSVSDLKRQFKESIVFCEVDNIVISQDDNINNIFTANKLGIHGVHVKADNYDSIINELKKLNILEGEENDV